jgi:hypothetical protein
MRSRLTAFFAVAFMAVSLLGIAAPAKAGIGPADDRQIRTPTGWWTYNGVTASQIGSLVNANNAR